MMDLEASNQVRRLISLLTLHSHGLPKARPNKTFLVTLMLAPSNSNHEGILYTSCIQIYTKMQIISNRTVDQTMQR